MIINLYSFWPKSPAWIFYKELFIRFRDNYKINLNINPNNNNLDKTNQHKSVGIIFGNPNALDIKNIRKYNKIIGRLEPRGASKVNFKNYNFLINNSLESQDYFAYTNLDSFILPTFPRYQQNHSKIENNNQLVIGYHGNCFHIVGLMKRIHKELFKYSISKDKKIIIKIMSNKKTFLRHFPLWYFDNIKRSKKGTNLEFKFYNYDFLFMSEFMRNIDIGICPQLVPIKNKRLTKFVSSSLFNSFKEKNHDTILRYKETSNIGRLAIFSQFKIPVISDPCPSSCSMIGMNEFGLIALSDKQWIKSIEYLENKDIRLELGIDLNKRVNDLYSDNVVYRDLMRFLDNLITKFSN